ncbi:MULTISPECIES: hemolysin family protein [Nosocomiicoccus]|uniref:hemolysin family protein n=1 Tax=Nosocomiicoccus TaxID=489909 RepID=UPI000833454A|nr:MULTISPECIES: CNNM domain-containing protein [Nosocomiicoccus]MDK6863849.1 CNNM domain-containing protein [Nosocomiicoccus ampullae]OFS61235.1 hemolysin [Nosocomiicoccus sp. HMSC09A07]
MLIAIFILFFVSLFFSGSETALTAANQLRLQSEANAGDLQSKKLHKLVSKPSEFITTILIGNNIANLVMPVLLTTIAIEYGYNLTVLTIILTVSIILFAEILPKSIVAAFPEQVGKMVMPIINLFIIIFKPITIVLNKITDLITNKLSKGEKESWTVTKDEIMSIVDIAGGEGALDRKESLRLRGVLDFDTLNVKDVLQTPRTEMHAIQIDSTFEEVRDIVIEGMYTRYPVYGEDTDDIIGIFHTKYLLKWSLDPSRPFVDFCDTDPLRVREFNNIEEVLLLMTKHRRHMVIVMDEYGGTEGLLTHEDIIETLLGIEIKDELDTTESAIVRYLRDDVIVCDGKITLHRLNGIFQSNIPEEENTLSGYLYYLFEDIPERFDTIEDDENRYEILVMEENTIRLVRITKLEVEDDEITS